MGSGEKTYSYQKQAWLPVFYPGEIHLLTRRLAAIRCAKLHSLQDRGVEDHTVSSVSTHNQPGLGICAWRRVIVITIRVGSIVCVVVFGWYELTIELQGTNSSLLPFLFEIE